MLRELITLPLRIGARTARAGLRVAEAAAAVGLAALERLGEAALPGPSEAAVRTRATRRVGVFVVAKPRAVAETPTAAAVADAPAEAPAPPPAERVDAPAEAPAPPPAPAHVSEEPVLVEAFAEPGAEDGAGAEVHVREPWQGYASLTAKEVIARLDDAGPEALATVELYERAHRNRRTVLSAADRGLRRQTSARASIRAAAASAA
jgi:hypothetical protein